MTAGDADVDGEASAPPGRARSTGAAALAVAAGIFLSRIAGLVRVRVLAHYLGSSDAAGAFNAALRIPNLLQNLFGEGVLSASFIPVYARLRAEGREEEAGRVAGVVATLLALVVATLVAAGVWATPLLIDLIAPGFQGDVRALTVTLVRIMFPGVGLLVISAWCLGVLNSHGRFFLSYVAPVLWNVAMIATLLATGARWMTTRAGQMHLAELVAWATVAGAGLQLLAQLPSALLLARGARPSLRVGSEPVRQVLRSFGPVVMGRGVVQLSAYIDQLLASYLGPAAVAAMGYAQTLYLLPISLFGVSVSAAELPAMASDTAHDGPDERFERLRGRLEKALARIAFFVIPTVVAFLALGDVVVGAVLQTGKFGGEETVFVWTILVGSTVGLLAATQARLFSSAFYALRDTRTPLYTALLRVTLTGVGAWACALPLRARFGWSAAVAAAGITATAGVAGWLEFLVLRLRLTRRIGRFSVGVALLARLWAAAILAGAAGYGIHRLLPIRQPVVAGALVLGSFGAIYLGATLLLGVDQARALVNRVLRRR